MQCFKNAEEIDGLSVLDRAFHYGDGCFTTARIVNNQIELEARHQARLVDAVQRLSLSVNLDLIKHSLQKLQQQHVMLNGTLKVLISRGEGQRGYAIPHHPADVYLFYYPQNCAAFEYQTLKVSGLLKTQMGLSMPSLVGLKSLNRLEQVLLKNEALEQGWNEALVSDVQGYVVEGVSSNCFIRLNDTWISPELGYNGVHGVMRAEILARMQGAGISCQLRRIEVQALAQMQSLFFCNALQAMSLVNQFHSRPLAVQPCIELFETLQLHQMHDYV